MAQFIYALKGLGKAYPPDQVVFSDVWLSFLYAAKIGVLGGNGAGKSTLLRIMAGIDTNYLGEAFRAEGTTVGYLAQEPQLDETKTVLGNVEEGVAATRALLTKYDELTAKLGEDITPEQMEKLLEQQGNLQDQIEHADAWDLDARLELAMDALRLPPGDADVTKLSGGERRRVALCRLLLQSPDMLLIDEPTNHLDAESVAWLENFLQQYKAPSSQSRTTATSSTTSPGGSSSSIAERPIRGKATTPAGSNRRRSGSSSKRNPRASGSARSIA